MFDPAETDSRSRNERSERNERDRGDLNESGVYERTTFAPYLRRIGDVPLLTREEEAELGRRIEAGERAAIEATLRCEVARDELVRIAQLVKSGRIRVSDAVHASAEGDALAELRATITRVFTRPTVKQLAQLRPTRETFDRIRRRVYQERRHHASTLHAMNVALADIDRAKGKLVAANLRLVVSIAKRYRHRGLQLSDLVQEGNLGLMHATDKFDYSRGYKFSTYATWWIRQAITRSIIEQGPMIRLPVHVADTKRRVDRAVQGFQQRHGRDPEIADVAAECSLPEAKVASSISLVGEPVSLDAPRGEAAKSLLEDLNATEPNAYAILLGHEQSEVIERLLRRLSERERRVLKLRFGIGGGRDHTLEEVGRFLGVTRERIRQLEKSAMEKLRKAAAQKPHDVLDDDANG